MDSSNSNNQQQQAADGTTPPPTPDTTQQGDGSPATVPASTKYDQMVSNAVQALTAVRAALPALPASVVALTDRKRRNVGREFLASAVTAVSVSPELRAITQLDPERGQDTLALLDAGVRLVQELKSTVKYVELVLLASRVELGADSREAYKAAKGISQTVKGSSLVVHVQAMKRGGRFTNGASKRKEGGNQPNQGA